MKIERKYYDQPPWDVKKVREEITENAFWEEMKNHPEIKEAYDKCMKQYMELFLFESTPVMQPLEQKEPEYQI